MKIDVFDKKLRPVAELAGQLLPNRPSPPTLSRWSMVGIKAPNGDKIKLPVVKLNGRSYSTPEAFRYFLEASNADAPAPGPSPEALAQTDDELRAAGLLDDAPSAKPSRTRRSKAPASA